MNLALRYCLPNKLPHKFVWLVALSSLWLVGCGSSEEQPVPVQGTVTLDGAPLAEGKIFFITLGQVPESVDIKDGKFSGKAKQGSRRIEIAAYRPVTIPPEVPESMRALMKGGLENYLPEKYHTNSEFTFEVKKGGPNILPPYDLLSN